jgi:hypothetical protein
VLGAAAHRGGLLAAPCRIGATDFADLVGRALARADPK